MLRHIVKRWRQFIADTAPVKPEPVERRSFRVTDEAVSAAGRSPSTMVARKLRAPELPPGVIPAQDSQERATDMMAMDDATMAPVWGWANMMAGFGCGLYFPGYPYLAELFQRSEYRAPSETMAKEMTRKWIKLKSTGEGDKSAKLERMNADIKQFGLQKIFRDAALWSRAFGRAQVYINIKDPVSYTHLCSLQSGAESLSTITENFGLMAAAINASRAVPTRPRRVPSTS